MVFRIDNISVRRGDRLTLGPCSLSVEPGVRVALYGPNGAGKSTLLQASAGLLPISSGRVQFRGKTVGEDMSLLDFHRQTAAVFQEPLLLRGTVRHNVELGLKLRGISASDRAKRASSVMERLRVSHLADRPANLLSGGEAQRTSLARALVLEPELLFLDEPFAALDAPTRTRLLGELAEILDERRIATLFVTHDLDEAAELCERCLVLDGGVPLQHDLMSAILERPASPRVAEIIGARNIFTGTVATDDDGTAIISWCGYRIRTNVETRAGDGVTFLLRDRDLALSKHAGADLNEMRGKVTHVRRRGIDCLVRVHVGDLHDLHVRCGAGEVPSVGEEVGVTFPSEAVWVFPT